MTIPTRSLTFDLGGDLTVHRLGYEAMQLPVPAVWGEPADRAGAVRVVQAAVEHGGRAAAPVRRRDGPPGRPRLSRGTAAGPRRPAAAGCYAGVCSGPVPPCSSGPVWPSPPLSAATREKADHADDQRRNRGPCGDVPIHAKYCT